jgi:hypothetical protein
MKDWHDRLNTSGVNGNIMPFWRVLSGRTPTTKRLSFGANFVAEQRKREGLRD